MRVPFPFSLPRMKAAFLPLFLGCFLHPALHAQRYNISYAPNSQEGLLLQLIEQLEGPAKLQQMDLFLQRYPNHPSVAWIYAYQQEYYAKEGQVDKALAVGEKLIALNPDDLEAAILNQKQAGKKNDPDLIRKWTQAVTATAQKLLGAPRPFYVPLEEWNKRIEYAGNLISQSEYQLYKQALTAEKPETQLKLFNELLTKNPNSIYAVQAYPHMLHAYRTIGNNVKAHEVAEKILSKDANQEDALLMVAQINLDRRANYPRVISAANRLLALYTVSAAKPENFTPEDWEKRRLFYISAGYQLLGTAYVFQNNFIEADKTFRAVLPYVKGNAQAEATALFYIGWSNYYLENYKEAARFFKSCLAIPGPFQAQANRQLEGMRRERRIVED